MKDVRKSVVRNIICGAIFAVTAICLSACEHSSVETGNTLDSAGNAAPSDGSAVDDSGSDAEDNGAAAEEEHETLKFVDVYGQWYETEIDPDVEKHTYDVEAFRREGDAMSYTGDDRYSYRLGVDVSYYQGDIDWARVKAAGYDFAFVRVGLRGYGSEGVIKADEKYADNIRNAQAAGLDVGVYFFAQAVNEEEAAEEARFVLECLSGYELQLPVVYDPEHILEDTARTDNVSGEQFTRNTEVFCRTVKEAGYQPMIYCNMLWEAFELDLAKLAEYPVWYADYEPKPQTPYHFDICQYSNTGQVDGIGGNVDLNIQLFYLSENVGMLKGTE